MNFTIKEEDVIMYPQQIYIHPEENLTTWGIFLSSLLLSLGGLFSMIIGSLSKSKCSQITCCGSDCTRQVENV